jgi:hypothetical protein
MIIVSILALTTTLPVSIVPDAARSDRTPDAG